MSDNWLSDCERFHRRDVLRVGVLSALGLTMSKYFALAEGAKPSVAGGAGKPLKLGGRTTGTADSAILIWLAGGPSHIDTFDPKPDAPLEIRGDFKAIPTKGGGHLSEHLPKLAAQMDKATIVNSVTSPTGAHEIGTHYMLTGFLPLPGFAVPSYGAVASHLLGPRSAIPPYISIQQPGDEMGAGFLGAALNPFCPGADPAAGDFKVRDLDPPNGMTVEKLTRRRKLRDAVDAAFKAHEEKGSDAARAVDSFYNRAYTLLSSEQARAAFDLRQEKDDLRNNYGRNTFGQSLLLSRRLVEAGVRFSTVTVGGWDNHNNIFNSLRYGMLPNFDQSMATFLADMSSRGLLDRTLVIVMGEFGRTPIINRDGGRDHHARVFSMMLAGGGIKGGNVVGASDSKGMEPASDPVRPEDIAATIYQCLGIDYSQPIASPEGVRITLARGGNPIRKALA